ncbi:alpha/beta fold hydrolase [Actinomadura rupiterrae]|uniref:alpha/beta fold hydrolase n=1 Tax=Actinomadura rupiterrae TaxID=559627 RepID=UPI0020A51B7F|nr:alpha/beta fold hydrolase [Actinomadura rupiterrae]MCP2336051.1 pimeloyl-ACP methyl ester carboxylesterase [Actinomadura rupiterrae]
MTTYLLVHGAWHSGRAWERVVPLLEGAGHRALAPTLTGYGDKIHLAGPDVGLGTHVDDITTEILANGLTDVVLVGHSYAGMVISGVAHRVPDRIARLVFLDAMVPVDGETAMDVMPAARKAAEHAADGWRVPPPPEQPPPLGLFGVTDPDDAAWLRTLLSDQPIRCLTEPVRMDDPAANTIPRTHIHCVGPAPKGITRRPVPDTEPDGTPSRVLRLDTGHDCMITTPRALTDLLLTLA